jgi:hypothetical protein
MSNKSLMILAGIVVGIVLLNDRNCRGVCRKIAQNVLGQSLQGLFGLS